MYIKNKYKFCNLMSKMYELGTSVFLFSQVNPKVVWPNSRILHKYSLKYVHFVHEKWNKSHLIS